MKAVLLRSRAVSVQSQLLTGSPKPSLSRQNSISCDKFAVTSPKTSRHRSDISGRGIRRVSSESDVIRSESESISFRFRSQSFSTRIPEDEYLAEGNVDLKKNRLDDVNNFGIWQERRVPVEEFELSGGGIGRGRKAGGGDYGSGGFASGNEDRSKIGPYYEQMLKSNPSDPLLLRNYGKYLHEVEKDVVRAEEYYGRAVLASPGDGELLSLYGNLIWETQRDEKRARSYFDQAVQASPEDCTVLASYARFMWEAGEDEGEEGMGMEVSRPAMVAAV